MRKAPRFVRPRDLRESRGESGREMRGANAKGEAARRALVNLLRLAGVPLSLRAIAGLTGVSASVLAGMLLELTEPGGEVVVLDGMRFQIAETRRDPS